MQEEIILSELFRPAASTLLSLLLLTAGLDDLRGLIQPQ